MEQVALNSNGLTSSAGEITAYNFDPNSREYLSASVENLPQGVGLPAHSCADEPPEKKGGFVVCRTAELTGWEYVADHRGEALYDIRNQKKAIMTELGDYPSELTPLAPHTAFDRWVNGAWVTDSAAQSLAEITAADAEKHQLLQKAGDKINTLQDAVELDMATEDEKAQLTAWRKYRVLLTRIDTSSAPTISWPKAPDA